MGTATMRDQFARALGYDPGEVSGEAWRAPTNQAEATALINDLSHEITLILAQLAERPGAWCERTGRTPQDYAAWRRRALFAKAHKENLLRECKRLRHQFVGQQGPRSSDHGDAPPDDQHLRWLCREAVASWRESAGNVVPLRLKNALTALAAHLEATTQQGSF